MILYMSFNNIICIEIFQFFSFDITFNGLGLALVKKLLMGTG